VGLSSRNSTERLDVTRIDDERTKLRAETRERRDIEIANKAPRDRFPIVLLDSTSIEEKPNERTTVYATTALLLPRYPATMRPLVGFELDYLLGIFCQCAKMKGDMGWS
jgi:hypothetical protein